MYDSVINLLNDNLVKDDDTGIYGISEPSYEATKVYAEVDSISRSEWSNAGNLGLNAEFRFRMPRSSYNNQMALEYNGVRYSVYRTYTAKNEIELYCQKATGETHVG